MGSSRMDKLQGTLIPSLLGILILLGVAVKSKLSCFHYHFNAILAAELEEHLKVDGLLWSFFLPIKLSLVQLE